MSMLPDWLDEVSEDIEIDGAAILRGDRGCERDERSVRLLKVLIKRSDEWIEDGGLSLDRECWMTGLEKDRLIRRLRALSFICWAFSASGPSVKSRVWLRRR